MKDREIELKLEGDPEALESLCDDHVFLAMVKGEATDRLLRSIYFDTPDFALMNNGFALRVREDGRNRIQTLKSSSRSAGPASDRGEWEHALKANMKNPDFNHLPSELRSRIVELAGQGLVQPRFVSTISRRASRLQFDHGGEVELVVDRGAIEANGRKSEVSELELEVKRGTAADLYQMALKLIDLAPLRIGIRSKAERGRALANGQAVVARRATPLRIKRKATIEEAYATVLEHCLDQVTANQAVVLEAHSPEGLHQMRVALRRLRSALIVFGPIINGEREDGFKRDARWLTKAVGRARDYDVVLADIIDPALAASKDKAPIVKALARMAKDYREEAWRAALAAMRSKRATRFVLNLALYLETRGWREGRTRGEVNAMREPLAPFAASALDKRLKSVHRLARDISELAIDDRHELRKRLKKLRYALSFFAGLYPRGAANAYLTRLSNLQKVFGSLNDLQTAEDILKELSKKSPRFEKPGAHLLAHHKERAAEDWHSALELWRDFRNEPVLWR